MRTHDESRLSDADAVETRLSRLGQDAAQEANLHRIFEEVPLPLIVSQAADGRILYTNGCLQRCLGVSAETLNGHDLSYIIPKLADRRRLAKHLAKHGSVHALELEGRCGDGSLRWFSIWQKRVICGQGECLAMILVDITDSKREQLALQENRQVLQQLLEVSEHDREAIAYEIHDGIVQEMTAALMHVEVARRSVEKGRPDAAEQLQTVTRLLRDGIREARQLMDGAQAPDLDHLGLLGALEALVGKFVQTSALTIEFVPQVAFRRLAPKWERAIYRIVQEGLNNIRRHSRSRRARVELNQQDERLQILIQDWGVGFDPRQISDKTFGLRGLRQRASLLGGSTSIDSRVGKGTTVLVELPLGPAAGAS